MAKEKRYISEEERLAARSNKKRKKSWTKKSRTKDKPKSENRLEPKYRIAVLVLVLVVAIIVFGRVKEMISLNVEHRRLVAQQEKLEEERDRLESKLKNVDNADYIEEQARKQLRLMNPDETLFIFDEEGKSAKK
ncbi:MAG: cell division protein FtsL [Clostridiales bacterium]|nr:cell division protein FtsL [Candidatus Crickella merdequi]